VDERTIRGFLRGATSERILDGWYMTGTARTHHRYIVKPCAAPCLILTVSEAVDYCTALQDAGVEPMWRTT
jgi:hypothetical protein